MENQKLNVSATRRTGKPVFFKSAHEIRRKRNAWKHAAHKRRLRTDPAYRVRYNRKKKLRSDYGLSLKDYELMFELQGGACAICGTTDNGGRVLAVDHDHGTGRVRGLLCNACNSALGQFRDRPDVLLAGARYLRQYGRR